MGQERKENARQKTIIEEVLAALRTTNLDAQVLQWLAKVTNVRYPRDPEEPSGRRFEARRLIPLALWTYRPVAPGRGGFTVPGRRGNGSFRSWNVEHRLPAVSTRIAGRRIVRPPSRRERIATKLADLRCRERWRRWTQILARVEDGRATAGERPTPVRARDQVLGTTKLSDR